MAKKDPYRFCIKFNERDPRQVEAAQILSGQNRSMAQFISNALLHYISCDKSVIDDADKNEILLKTIRETIEQTMEQKVVPFLSKQSFNPPEKKVVEGKNIDLGNNVKLDETSKSDIAAMLQSFRDNK